MPLCIGIAKSNFPSCTSVTNKLFISSSIKPLYDGRGPLVRRETVALEKGVRFSPVVLYENFFRNFVPQQSEDKTKEVKNEKNTIRLQI